jgi:hypothetical protein
MTTGVVCSGCGAELRDDPPDQGRTPCPACGSTQRSFDGEVTLAACMGTKVGMKARHPGARRPYVECVGGDDVQRATGRRVKHERTIDREADLYEERVVDAETGAVIHTCREPLSKHRAHGSAKHRR